MGLPLALLAPLLSIAVFTHAGSTALLAITLLNAVLAYAGSTLLALILSIAVLAYVDLSGFLDRIF